MIHSGTLSTRLNRFALTIAGALFLTATAASANEHKAYPVDEAQRDGSFVEFREKLLEAVVQRDANRVVSYSTKKINLSYGGHFGHKEFRKFLTLSEDDLSDEYKHEAAKRREGYWNSLEEVLRMGGKFTRANIFEAPYTWTVKLNETQDPFSTYFVVSKDVPVRNRPSKYGTVMSTLDYDIVTSMNGGEGTGFIKVKLPGRDAGFVKKSDLRSSVDFRAIFRKRNGRWLMDTFISGD